MLSFTIDKNDWIRGVSISQDHNDGGFSPFAQSYNLELAKAGLLYPQPARSNISSTVVVSSMVAFTSDPNFLGNDGYGVDDGGNFYTIDNGTPVKRQTDAVKSYIEGTTQIRFFKGSLFATSNTDIAKLDNSNLTNIDNDWWTATQGESALQSSYRHCMEIVEDTLYIADEYRIHTWDGATSVYEAMTLPTGYNITNLIVHTDGRHLLAFAAETANYSHTVRARAKIFIIDTVNLEFIREIDIDSQVEGSINVGGVIYVTYGANLGYFNGDGVQFLRKLGNSISYNNALANKEGTLLVREGNAVLAYGNLGLGNIFYYVWSASTDPSVGAINSIYYYGSNQILTSGNTQKLNLIDFTTCADFGAFETNFYSFPSKVWIREIRIETEVLASGSYIDFYSLDKRRFTQLLTTLYFPTDGAISEARKFCNILTDLFRLRIVFQVGNTKGIRKITVFYEDAE